MAGPTGLPEGTAELLMVYRDDGSASYVGLERVVGRVGDRSGSFVLRHGGTFEGTTAKTARTVVAGFVATEGRHVPSVTLDYDFE